MVRAEQRARLWGGSVSEVSRVGRWALPVKVLAATLGTWTNSLPACRPQSSPQHATHEVPRQSKDVRPRPDALLVQQQPSPQGSWKSPSPPPLYNTRAHARQDVHTATAAQSLLDTSVSPAHTDNPASVTISRAKRRRRGAIVWKVAWEVKWRVGILDDPTPAVALLHGQLFARLISSPSQGAERHIHWAASSQLIALCHPNLDMFPVSPRQGRRQG